jgi:hypothetical protein
MWIRLLIILAALSAAAHADNPISRCMVDPGAKEVSLEMSAPNLLIDTGPVAAKQWTVEIKGAKDDLVPNVAVYDVTIPPKAARYIILKLSSAMPLKDWSEVYVAYQPNPANTFRCIGQPPDKGKPIAGADSKDSADLYLQGSYSPRIGSPAQYSYDVAIGYGQPISKNHARVGLWGVSITGTADQRPNLDPDSYYAGALWKAFPALDHRGPLQGIVSQVDMGGEFARKKFADTQTKTSNFLAPAPRLEFPMRLYPKRGESLHRTTLMLRPIVGFDWGHNFQNALQPDGSGLMARALAGGDFVLTYSTKRAFRYSFTVSSSWRGRYPLRKGIDTTSVYNPSKQDFDFTFQVTRKPRNDVSSKFTWKWTEYFGLTVSHELGALPPLYNYVDHSVTVGLTFSARLVNRGIQRRQ